MKIVIFFILTAHILWKKIHWWASEETNSSIHILSISLDEALLWIIGAYLEKEQWFKVETP